MVYSKSASDKTILISSIESDNVSRNFCFVTNGFLLISRILDSPSSFLICSSTLFCTLLRWLNQQEFFADSWLPRIVTLMNVPVYQQNMSARVDKLFDSSFVFVAITFMLLPVMMPFAAATGMNSCGGGVCDTYSILMT